MTHDLADRHTGGARNRGRPKPGMLAQRLSAEQTHERRAVLRGLLLRPLLLPTGETADRFQLARRHADWLKNWLQKHPGWHLRIDSRCIRLRKTPAQSMLADPTRGARDPHSKRPMNRRRYALLCLSLAELGRLGHQVTLGKLAEQLILATNMLPSSPEPGGEEGEHPTVCADQPAVRLTLQYRSEREDLVHAIRLLVDLGVLARLDGDEQGYIADGKRDVLYNIDREAVAAVLSVRRGPSTVEARTLAGRIAAIAEEPAIEGRQAELERCKHNLYRRLLEQPVVYFDELPQAERDYFTGQRATLCRVIEEATGLIAEIRQEGIAMVDETGLATDRRVLEPGTDGHAALLVAGFCTRALQAGDTVVNRVELEKYIAQQAQLHRVYWRKETVLPGAEVALVQDALDRLVALRLISIRDGQVHPRPAIARYGIADHASALPEIQDGLLSTWEEVEA